MSLGVCFFCHAFLESYLLFLNPKHPCPLFPKTPDGCKEAASVGADTWQRKGLMRMETQGLESAEQSVSRC